MLDVFTPQITGDLGTRNPKLLLTPIGNPCSHLANNLPPTPLPQLLLTHLPLAAFLLNNIFYAFPLSPKLHLP